MTSTVDFTIRQDEAPDIEVGLTGPGSRLIDAGPCTVFVEGPPGSVVRCDGRDVPTLVQPTRFVAQCSLTDDRLLGIRRIEVSTPRGSYRLDVCLTGARAALDDLSAAVAIVLDKLPRHHGPFWYLDSRGTRRVWVDHARAVAFATDNVDTIERVVRAIDAAPCRDTVVRRRRTAVAVHVDMAATRDLLLRHPDLVNRSPGGIRRASDRIVPAQVITVRRARTVDTVDHRRATAFVAALHRDLDVAGKSGALDAATAAGVEQVARRLSALVATTFLDSLRPTVDALADREPTRAEATDARYAELRHLREHYLSEVQPALALDPYGRQFLPRPDEVYQAFAVYMVAAALEMEEVDHPAPDGAAFISDDFELYYNVAGPLEGWRQVTDRPDAYRPDVVLRRRDGSRRVVVLDAKYAVSTDGRLPGERRKELDAYMGAFGLSHIGALYPGSTDGLPDEAAGFELRGYGRTIIEVPLRGRTDEEVDAVLRRLRNAVHALETTQHLAHESP